MESNTDVLLRRLLEDNKRILEDNKTIIEDNKKMFCEIRELKQIVSMTRANDIPATAGRRSVNTAASFGFPVCNIAEVSKLENRIRNQENFKSDMVSILNIN